MRRFAFRPFCGVDNPRTYGPPGLCPASALRRAALLAEQYQVVDFGITVEEQRFEVDRWIGGERIILVTCECTDLRYLHQMDAQLLEETS